MLEGNIREEQLKKLVEEYLPEVIFLPKKQFEERLALKGYRYLEMGMQDYICCKRLITGPQTYPERGIHQFAIGLTACTDHPAMAENKATAFCRSIQYQSNGIHAGTLPTEKQLVTLNAENVVLSAVWMEKKELRIRLYETGGEESTSTLVFDGNVVSAEACDGLGQCLPANVQVTDNRVSFTIPAFQLMEIRAVLA